MSFVGVLLATTALLSVAIVWSFTRRTIADAAETSAAMLERSVYALDLTHSQVVGIANGLLDSPVIVAALYGRHVDRVLEYHANLEFASIRNVYPFIRFIAIANAEMGRYINPEGLTTDTEAELIERAFARTELAYVSFFPRLQEFPLRDELPAERLVTFVFSPDLRFQTPPRSRILIHLAVDHMERSIAAIGAEAGSDVYVIDDRGRIVAGGEEGAFMSSVLETAWWTEVSRSSLQDGGAVVRTGDGRELVTFARSSETGWTVVSRRPYRNLVRNLLRASRTVLVIAAVVVLAGVALGVIMVQRVYNPLGALVGRVHERSGSHVSVPKRAVNEFDLLRTQYDRFLARVNRLESTIEDDLNVYRAVYAQSLLLGNRFDSFPSKSVENRVTRQLDWPAFVVVLVSIDRYRLLGESQSTRDLASVSAAILAATRDILSSRTEAIVVGTSDNEIAALLRAESASDRVLRDVTLTELQRTVADSVGVSVSIAVGPAENERAAIHDSFLAARHRMMERFFTGPGSILRADRDYDWSGYLPVDTEKVARSVLENLRVLAVEEAMTRLEAFSEQLRAGSYHTAVSAVQRLADALHMEIRRLRPDSTGNGADPGGEDAPDRRRRAASIAVAEVDFLEDATAIVRNLMTELVAVIDRRQSNRKELLLTDLKQIVQDSLSNPSLNVDMVAGQAGISGGYVGKLFRELTNETFGHYVNRLRIEKAAALLRSSSMTVKSVSHAVGIDNEHYFFTLFRKHYGESPARYRSANGS